MNPPVYANLLCILYTRHSYDNMFSIYEKLFVFCYSKWLQEKTRKEKEQSSTAN